jgi:hypothetical protein
MYRFVSPTDITPRGWLRRQLEIEANGLCGNLDKVWPDVSDSKWIGGNKEGWERVPYWLDGFIPLAWLLHDKDMMARAEYYINSIIDRQQEDGWICPCPPEKRPTYDIWAFFLIGKVLTVYCEFTGSEKAEQSLYRAMKCLDDIRAKGELTIKNWGKFRWFECLIPLQYLYDKYHEEWIRELARFLRAEGVDYKSFIETWKRPLNKWTFHTHIVNLAMMFKYEAVSAELFGEEITGEADMLWDILEEYNGTAVGAFTGDECLGGRKNNRGAELCSIVELMYTLEILYSITGDGKWADRLEKLAFNALPATISDDMWTHQYDQMVNQISCTPFYSKSLFGTNDKEAHLFGLEPHYGCCTANHGQGWPKLVTSIFRVEDDGITAAMMLPCELDTKIGNNAVKVKIETEYPFENTARYIIETESEISFSVRIPVWATGVLVDGKKVDANGKYTIKASGKTEFSVTLIAKATLVNRPYDLCAVEYGALVYSLPLKAEYKMLEYERNGVARKFPYCDYELSSTDEWRYGIHSIADAPKACEGDDIPFSSKSPRLTLGASLCRVAWDFEEGYDNASAYAPESRIAMSEPVAAKLIPYGCAKLRMTEMPKVK